VPAAAALATGSPFAREILKRARSASQGSLTALEALATKPSSAALAQACNRLGEVEAYLVVLSYLLNEKAVAYDVPATPLAGPHADPRSWVSTAERLAPLCHRPGSSADDFASDIAEAKKNLATAVAVLTALN
jgi:hypothetical protein